MSPEEKKIRKLLSAIPTKPSLEGGVIKLRDGTTYVVGRRGNWIKIKENDERQTRQP